LDYHLIYWLWINRLWSDFEFLKTLRVMPCPEHVLSMS
jgi:hypothetical protein